MASPCGLAPASALSRYQYTHDAEGNRLTQVEELTRGGVLGAPETTEYGYDEESRLVGVRYPDDTVALYQLDAVGNRVGERKAPSSAVTALTMAAFLSVSPTALTHDVLAVFNRADWLTSQDDAKSGAHTALTWDNNGNMTSKKGLTGLWAAAAW